jgi:hypothetical protein
MAVSLHFGRFVLCAQTSGTQIKMADFAVDIYSNGVDIGHPASVGMAFGVADVMTEKRHFTA